MTVYKCIYIYIYMPLGGLELMCIRVCVCVFVHIYINLYI